MKVKLSPQFFATTFGAILFAQGLVAQTTIQLFGPVNVARSVSSASYSTPYAFNTNTLNLTCPTTGITAMLSGPSQGNSGPLLSGGGGYLPGGNLLVDNNIIVTVAPAGTLPTPANVCPNTIAAGGLPANEALYANNCFNGIYEGAAQYIIGLNPDTSLVDPNTGLPNPAGQPLDSVGGVPQIDISGYLNTTGLPQDVTIALDDEGGEVAGSTVFLTTNCTQGPVTGPGQISGSPIVASSGQGLTQTFTFNSNAGNPQSNQPPQVVSFVYDLSAASAASSLTQNENTAVPVAGDLPVDPTTFQSTFVPQTSFATSNCLIHTGEALTNGNAACKLYTLECTTVNSNNLPTGAQCPVSSQVNEIVGDIFDGPAFGLQNIYTPGDVFHEGIGFLMASDTWSATSGGPCGFDPTSGLGNLPCPQNLITSFSGPGKFSGQGTTTNPNSTFITVAGVPEDKTAVSVSGEWPDHWVNTHTPQVSFNSEAPNLSKGASVLNGSGKLVALPGAGNYIPAPIKSITYGVSSAGSVPMPVNEPIASDATLLNPAVAAGCPVPTSGSPGPKVQPNFVPPVQTLSIPTDGQYLLHYYAQDCAGTQELQFVLNPASAQNPAPYWTTSFYTRELNVDTNPPVVTPLTLSPAGGSYKVGAVVTASFSCSDLNTGAGVVLCGSNVYATETTYNTPKLTLKVPTGSAGSKTFTVYAVDGAGNISSKSIAYSVTK